MFVNSFFKKILKIFNFFLEILKTPMRLSVCSQK